MPRLADWFRASIQPMSRADRRRQRKALAHPRRLRLESLEDRRMLAYTLSFDSTNEVLTIQAAATDTAALSITESGENLNVADAGEVTFNSGTLTGTIGVTVTSSGVTINEADTNVAYVNYDLSDSTGTNNTITFGDLPSPIQGFGVNGSQNAAYTVNLTGNITTSSNLPIGGDPSSYGDPSFDASIDFNYDPNINIDAANVTLTTAATAADTPGNVGLGVQVYADAPGNDLTIDTSPAGAGAPISAGYVSLGDFGNGGTYSYVDNFTVNSTGRGGAADGVISSSIVSAQSITTDGSQAYLGKLDVGFPAPAVNLTSNGGASIDFDSVEGTEINGGPVVGDLTISTQGTTQFDGAVSVGSLDVATGPTEIDGGSISTTSTQNYVGPVTIGSNTTLSSTVFDTDADITFGSTIDGNGGLYSLQIATHGQVDLAGAVGGSASDMDLAQLTVYGGGIEIEGGFVAAQGLVDFETPTVVTSDTVFATGGVGLGTGPGIEFLSTLDGNNSDPNVTFSAPKSAQVEFYDDIGGAADAPDLSSVTSTGWTWLLHNVSTTGAQTYAGPVEAEGSPTLSSAGTGSSGAITFKSTVDGTQGWSPGNLVAATQGATDFEGEVTLGSLDVESGPTVINGGIVSTTSTQNYAGAVSLSQNTTLRSAGTGADGNITFGSTLDGGGLSLLLIYTGGQVDFEGAVGGAPSAPDLLELNVETGPTEIEGGSIATVWTQAYAGPVTISGETTLSSTASGLAGEIIFGSTIDGIGGLDTLTVATAGLTEFQGAIGGSASSPDMEALDVAGPARIGGGSIATQGTQSYAGAVAISSNTTLTSASAGAAGAITFGSAVDSIGGLYALNVATPGLTDFQGVVGGPANLPDIESLDVQVGPAEIDGGSISTSATQIYGGAVTISSETWLTSTGAGAITFGSTVDGIGGLDTLHVVTSGLATFGGALGGSASSPDMEALDVEIGPALIEGGSISTHSVQYYGQQVTATQDTTFTSTGGGWIRFNSSLDGSDGTEALVVDTAGLTTFSGAVGGSASSPDLGSLNMQAGPAVFGGGSISTGGAQWYSHPVTITQGTTFTSSGGGSISFISLVGGSAALVVDTTGLTIFDSRVDGTDGPPELASIDITAGPMGIYGGSVATLGPQTYAGAVTISEETTLKSTGTGAAGAVTFGSTIDGIGGLDTLHVVTAGLTDFQGAVGGSGSTPDMEAIDVQVGPAEIGGGSIFTRSVQYYGNAVTITQQTSLTSSGGEFIDFNSTVDSSGGLFTLHSITSALTTFNGAVGGSTSSPDMEALDVQVGPAKIDGGSILTHSVQYYGNAVTITQNTSLTSTGGEYIEFHSTVDAGGSPAGLTITTSYPYTNDSGSPQLFNAAVGGQSPLRYLVANVEGGIVLNSPISTTGDMLLGGTALMPAVLQVNANLTSTGGSIGLTSSMRVFTSIGDTISAAAGTINFSAGGGSSDSSLVSPYSTMQATGVFVTGSSASNQLVLPPPGQDSVINESGINSGTIGSYQGTSAAGVATPFVQYTNEQNIALDYFPGTESTSTLSIFTANNSSPTPLTNVIDPIASFNPYGTSASANTASFYLDDTYIDNVQVRVGRGNQTVDASQTNANTLLEGDAYQEAGVSDTLMGGHAFNVLIGGQSQATLVAGDGADLDSAGLPEGLGSLLVANYIFTHYEYTVAGGVGQWMATPTSIGGNPISDTVNSSVNTQNENSTNSVVANGADEINESGIILTSEQGTRDPADITPLFTQDDVNEAQQSAIETIFPQTASATGVFSSNANPAGTQVTAAIPINYSPTPTSQSTNYAAPPLFYVPGQYASGRTPLLISDPAVGDTIHFDFSSNGSQVKISVDGFSQTLSSSLFSSIQIAANGNNVEISATSGNTIIGSINAQSKQAYASMNFNLRAGDEVITDSEPGTIIGLIPSLNVSGAQTLTISNESNDPSSLAALYQLSSSVSVASPNELADGSSSITLNNYGSGMPTIYSQYARP